MKVVFLDVDGVLNHAAMFQRSLYVDKHGRTDYSKQLDAAALGRLQQIVQATGAKVVISSAWRLASSRMAVLLRVLKSYGIEPISTTPCKQSTVESVLERRGPSAGFFPGQFIETWLRLNTDLDIETFVILDDSGHMEPLEDRLVKTRWSSGLLDDHVEWAIRLLNKESLPAGVDDQGPGS